MSIINRETDYAMRFIRCLSNGGKKSVSQICSEEIIAINFGYKIVKKLENSGIVQISRGTNGGVCLIKSLHDISLLDLMDAIDEKECLMLNNCSKQEYECEYASCNDCKIHKNLMLVEKSVALQFAGISLYSLLFDEFSQKDEYTQISQ